MLSIEYRELPYVPQDSGAADMQAWLDEATLEVVNPDWEDIVTAEWKQRMRGEP